MDKDMILTVMVFSITFIIVGSVAVITYENWMDANNICVDAGYNYADSPALKDFEGKQYLRCVDERILDNGEFEIIKIMVEKK